MPGMLSGPDDSESGDVIDNQDDNEYEGSGSNAPPGRHNGKIKLILSLSFDIRRLLSRLFQSRDRFKVRRTLV